jgi:hypothetical protein
MKITAVIGLVLGVALLWSSLAFAEVKVTPEGKVFWDYYFNMSNYPDTYADKAKDNFNGFELGRTYLGARATFNDEWMARIVYDVGRSDLVKDDGAGNLSLKKGAGPYTAFVKYAYLNYQVSDMFAIRVGQHETPYVDVATAAWRYRFINLSMTDKNKWDTSADLGVSVLGKLPQNFGSYQVGLFNGEGFKAPEVNEGKELHLRATLTPFQSMGAELKGLALTGSYFMNWLDLPSDTTQSHWNALLHYFYQMNADMSLSLAFEITGDKVESTVAGVTGSVDGSGYAFYGEFIFTQGVGVFGRYDSVKLNNDDSQKDSTYLVAGLSYAPLKNVRFALDFQQSTYGKTGQPDDKLIFVNGEFGF